MNKDMSDVMIEEINYFDFINDKRKSTGFIYPEVDLRSKDVYLSDDPADPPADPYVTEVFSGLTSLALAYIKDKPGALLDVCCGPGWLSLESARLGHVTTGIDISDTALNLARSYLATQNKETIDKLKYINTSFEDFFTVNQNSNFSIITGWSAFHHLLDTRNKLKQMTSILEEGGLMITFDDLEFDNLTLIIRKILLFILPIRGFSYKQKIKELFTLDLFKRIFANSIDSPAEIQAEKHGIGADIIFDYFTNDLLPLKVAYEGGFASAVSYRLRMPIWQRKITASILLRLENILLKIKLISPRYRLIVSRKISLI